MRVSTVENCWNRQEVSGLELRLHIQSYTHKCQKYIRNTNNDYDHLEPSDRAMMIILLFLCVYVHTIYLPRTYTFLYIYTARRLQKLHGIDFNTAV